MASSSIAYKRTPVTAEEAESARESLRRDVFTRSPNSDERDIATLRRDGSRPSLEMLRGLALASGDRENWIRSIYGAAHALGDLATPESDKEVRNLLRMHSPRVHGQAGAVETLITRVSTIEHWEQGRWAADQQRAEQLLREVASDYARTPLLREFLQERLVLGPGTIHIAFAALNDPYGPARCHGVTSLVNWLDPYFQNDLPPLTRTKILDAVAAFAQNPKEETNLRAKALDALGRHLTTASCHAALVAVADNIQDPLRKRATEILAASKFNRVG